jgi:hypothetical protein
MKIHRITIEELRAGIKLETGEHHKIIILRPQVLLELEWEESVVAELPDDLALGLTVAGAVQHQEIRNGTHADGRVQVAFRWSNENDPTSLLVSTDGRDVTLWKSKVIARDRCLNALAVLMEPVDDPEVPPDQDVEVLATLEPGPHPEEFREPSNDGVLT